MNTIITRSDGILLKTNTPKVTKCGRCGTDKGRIELVCKVGNKTRQSLCTKCQAIFRKEPRL